MINKPAPSLLRLLAYITEISFIFLIFMIFLLLAVSQPTLAAAITIALIYLITVPLNPLIYLNTIILTHYFGGSFGKLVTGLQVVNENGNPLTLKRIVFRQMIGYSFSWLVFGLGFASIIKDPQKQGWHDKTVGSMVVVKQNLWPLALLICIASIAGSVYLGTRSWQTITTSPIKTEAAMLIKQLNQQNEINDPAWKTYKNTVSPFEMKYPAGWNEPISRSGMVNFYNGYSGVGHQGMWVTVTSTYLGDGRYPGALPEFKKRYSSPAGPIETVRNKTATKIRNLKIDGVDAIEYEEIDNQTDVTGYSINYQMVKDNYHYRIVFTTVDKDLLDTSRDTFEKMLQSFRFTNKGTFGF